MSEYPFVVDIDVRLRDLDPMAHVNNAVYATYLENARVRYYADVIGETLSDVPTVIAHLSIDFGGPIDLPDEVEVAMRVPRLGESSIPMEYEVRANGEVAATAETVQVVFDRETGESKPIPAEWSEAIEAHEGL